MRAANFYFESGNSDTALRITSQILDQVSKYDSEIFSEYASQVPPLSGVLEHGLPAGNPRPALAWLNYVIGSKNVPEARRAWNWVRAHGFADPETTNGYVSFLLAQHLAPEALGAWKDYLGASAGDYGMTNYAFNGGFENEFSTSPLDWKSEPHAGIEVTRDDTKPDSGKWSLRIHLDGKQNIADTGVNLTVALPQGAYRLRARIRTEGLTTDQGIQLRIRSLDGTPSTSWTSRPWLGTNPWSTVATSFIVPANGNSYGIELVRNPSLKFDNLIAGTVWIDSVRIEPAQKQQ